MLLVDRNEELEGAEFHVKVQFTRAVGPTPTSDEDSNITPSATKSKHRQALLLND